MAKKNKKTTKKKSRSSRAGKNQSSKSPQSKTTEPTTSRKKSAKSNADGPRGNSVDNVLEKYQKERTSQEIQLATVRKKIDELEAKTRAFREQIAKLTKQEAALKNSMAQLDTRRDNEVRKLLEKLGVQLGGPGTLVREPQAKASTPPVKPESIAEDAESDDEAT